MVKWLPPARAIGVAGDNIEDQERQNLFQTACLVRFSLILLFGIYIQISNSGLTIFPFLKDSIGHNVNHFFWALTVITVFIFFLNRLRPIRNIELFLFGGIEVVLIFLMIGNGNALDQNRIEYIHQSAIGGKILLMMIPLMLAIMTLSIKNVIFVSIFIFISPFLMMFFMLDEAEREYAKTYFDHSGYENILWRPFLFLGVSAIALILVHRLRGLIAKIRVTTDHASALDRQFRRFMDATADQVVVFDRSGHVSVANQAAHARRTGADTDRRLAAYFGKLAAPTLIEAASRVSASPPDAAIHVEVSVATPGASRSGYATITRAGDWRESLFVAVVTDIDDLKKAQAELAVARENALAANLAKTAFLGRMSHELRTPLNAVMGFSSLARAEAQMLDPANGERLDDYLQKVEMQGGHLTSLIDSVLNYARVEVSGLKIELETEESAGTLLQRAIDRRREQADAAGVALRLDDGPSMAAHIRGDADLLIDALGHLIDNAIRHSIAGQDVYCGFQDGAALTVADNGPGLDADKVAMALAPLSQVGEYTKADDVGMGLGLAIVRAIAAAHDGVLEIETAPGQGLCGKIVLPRTRITGGPHALFRAGTSTGGADEAAA